MGDCRTRVDEASRNPTGESQWVTNVGSSARRNLPIIAGLALLHELAIHGNEDLLLPLTQPRIRFGCLNDRHPRPRLVLAVWQMTKQSGERMGLQAQHFLEFRDPLRFGRHLAKQPLGHRRLRHADRSGQSALRQATVLPGSLERLGEHLSLLGRCHRRDPLLGAPELADQACLIA